MGERKGVNKYYPPDFDPSKGSLNSWLGSHPLRDRARKLHKGILVIRFEMPYNIWCGGCNNHIGMGVRYNAEKSKVGNYYTTPIYKFRMKCHLCDNYFEIQTDPKNHDYVILEGARRKEQRWDPKENEQIVPEDKLTQKKLATDPMYKLEHGSDDKDRGKVTQLSVAQIEDMRESWNDDYMLNKLARSKFRVEKKEIATVKAADKALLDKSSLDIELVPETEDDHKLASLMKYSVTKSFDDKQKEKRKAIVNRPLFSKPTASCTITPKLDGSFSRRAQIKHKLGLHLTSAHVDHALPSSLSMKGLVKDVHRNAKRSSATENSDTPPQPSTPGECLHCSETVKITNIGHSSTNEGCETMARIPSTKISSSLSEASGRGEQHMTVDCKASETSTTTITEHSVSLLEFTTVEESVNPDTHENSVNTAKTDIFSEKVVCANDGLKAASSSDDSENRDEKTGLTTLMASYSDSDSNISDSS